MEKSEPPLEIRKGEQPLEMEKVEQPLDIGNSDRMERLWLISPLFVFSKLKPQIRVSAFPWRQTAILSFPEHDFQNV
jgi:hypothetical protein